MSSTCNNLVGFFFGGGGLSKNKDINRPGRSVKKGETLYSSANFVVKQLCAEELQVCNFVSTLWLINMTHQSYALYSFCGRSSVNG